MSITAANPFAGSLARWDLVPDGEPIATHSSDLLPVRWGGAPAVLKVARESEEKFGSVLMSWWDGDGAARVFAHDADAVVLERAQGRRSLAQMARSGRDGEATRIICGVIARLHAPRATPLPHLIPLQHWFKELEPVAAAQGGILRRCAETARSLLAAERDAGVLHGDIHHDNILDFGPRGWLAIDPKRLHGERSFDYANLFCNPEHDPGLAVSRFAHRVEIVAEAAQLERRRLLQWILAWAGLSAAWWIGDGVSPEMDFKVAQQAAAELDR